MQLEVLVRQQRRKVLLFLFTRLSMIMQWIYVLMGGEMHPRHLKKCLPNS